MARHGAGLHGDIHGAFTSHAHRSRDHAADEPLGNMWGLILTAGAVIVLALFSAVRCAVFHPLHVLYYGTLDTFGYIRRKQYNLCHTGDLDIYCGYFGSGKTLSLVHKVTGLYEHYDGKTVWCPRRKKFVTQRVLILSNVALSVPV
ncbi:MAG: hypothetical protein ACLRYE_08350 [Gemmiger formicilis]|uniref:hypothetical protein n=1 Tax=Gemmiger formicilis TaxID=745368 RepID=UPI0039A31AA7